MDFLSLSAASLRIDCMVLGTGDDVTGGADFSTFNGCEPNVTEIPVPAGLPLLLTGMGILGLGLRRRRRGKRTRL